MTQNRDTGTGTGTVQPAAVRPFPTDVVIVGGCGHVGLPLGIALASRGQRVRLYDIDAGAVGIVNEGRLPFREPGAAGVLAEMTAAGQLRATTDPAVISEAEHVVVVVGTPVDGHLNPDPQVVPRAIRTFSDHLVDGQLLILRSTVYPGVTALVEKLISEIGRDIQVAFCPERIAEGRAMTELFELPQIVAARTDATRVRATALFAVLTSEIVDLQPEEAELAKLFTNTWRYIKFATANQFYMIANDLDLDFERIRKALGHNYPRAADLPGAGLAAGPCLFKDTMQLAAVTNNTFALGHAAMLVNEGLPLYLVSRLKERFDLAGMVVGILGMAFKGGSDDTRASLSYKLRRILDYSAAGTLCTDPYVTTDARLLPLETVLERADLLVLAAPHPDYATLATDKPVVDIWNLLGEGVRV
nr:nucleotide sugar dehydrogenase [Frankia sp. Cr2]